MNLPEGILATHEVALAFESTGIVYRLPPELAVRMGRRPGRVVLGLHREAVAVVPDGREPGALESVVYVEELMGSDVLITLDMGGRFLKVRTTAQLSAGPGTGAYLRPDPAKIHLFDGDGEAAL